MPSERTIELSGVIANLSFIIESEDDPENALYRHARGLQENLREYAQNQVRELLGPEFAVVGMQVERGSAHILMAIGTAAGAVFLNFSRYESFIKSVNLLISQITGILRRFFTTSNVPGGIGPVTISGTWQTGPGMPSASSVAVAPAGGDINRILLAYLVASHAGLLLVLVWIVMRHLK